MLWVLLGVFGPCRHTLRASHQRLRLILRVRRLPALSPQTPGGAQSDTASQCDAGGLADASLFDFTGPTDPVSDAEALAEHTAIMMEANGWDEATAHQEATWQADRERCWRHTSYGTPS